MIAVKGNRQYTITEVQAKSYQRDGYDIKDENGNIIQHGAGKTISWDKHEAIVNELRSQVDSAKKKSGKGDLEALQKKYDELASLYEMALAEIKELREKVEEDEFK